MQSNSIRAKFVFLAAILPVFIHWGCRSSAEPGTAKGTLSGQSISEYADVLLGSHHEIVYNSDKSYALILKRVKTRPNDIFPMIHFHIVELASMKSILEDRVPRGHVEWKEAHIVQVASEPGIPGPGGDASLKIKYLFDVLKALSLLEIKDNISPQ